MRTVMNYEIVPLDMKGCICHFVKLQIHPFISKGTKYGINVMSPKDVISSIK